MNEQEVRSSSRPVERVGFDDGLLSAPRPPPTQMIETVIRNGPARHLDNFPGDEQKAFLKIVLGVTRQDVECFERGYNIYSVEQRIRIPVLFSVQTI